MLLFAESSVMTDMTAIGVLGGIIATLVGIISLVIRWLLKRIDKLEKGLEECQKKHNECTETTRRLESLVGRLNYQITKMKQTRPTHIAPRPLNPDSES